MVVLLPTGFVTFWIIEIERAGVVTAVMCGGWRVRFSDRPAHASWDQTPPSITVSRQLAIRE